MLKKFVRKLILREKENSSGYIAYLRKRGVVVGENCYVPEPSSVLVDLSEPWLITIGDNVTITHGVVILSHDYAWSVLKKHGSSRGAVFGAQAPVKLGNNIFVGVNAIITKGVTIGDNVIIGAGSLISKDCESNSLYAGNPAKRIMSIEEYAERRRIVQIAEAKKLAIAYRSRFSKRPPKEIFKEYFMLFSTVDEALNTPEFRHRVENCGNPDETIAYMNTHKPMFGSFEEFLDYCYQ